MQCSTRVSALLCAASIGCVGWAPASAAAMSIPAAETGAEVIVVGTGISGLSAALEAARGGARVRVVEMSSVFGGHAVMAHGGLSIVDTPIQRSQGISDSAELAAADFLAWGEDSDPGWVSFYTHNSRRLIFDWLTELGVRFSARLLHFPGNSVARFHGPEGHGLGLVSPIFRACLLHPSVEFLWNLRVDGLLRSDGRIVGIEGESTRTGERRMLRAPHVVLATGGFQSNLEMVREFWPARYPFPERILVGSGANSVGTGHRAAEHAGAALRDMDRQWNYATGLPDPRYPEANRGLNASNGASIWVNLQGERFVNETASTKERLRALLQQRPAQYWAIFDEIGKRRLFVSGSDWSDFATVERVLLENRDLVAKADSLEELAAATGLPAGSLDKTVERYNHLLETGIDSDFRRFGFGTIPYDLAPGSEAGAVPIVHPPFYAVPFYPLARKSMGGVAIDLETRVLSTGGKPIPGLYAVGELAGLGGINGWAALEGTFLGPSIVTGRVAGQTILAELRRDGSLGPVSETDRAAASASPLSSTPASPECESCHDVQALLATTRRGYEHFEKVHRVVVERRLACQDCHASMQPFREDSHVVDRVAQIEACASCHLAREH